MTKVELRPFFFIFLLDLYPSINFIYFNTEDSHRLNVSIFLGGLSYGKEKSY